MAHLAIRGHQTRGKEVIEILEMLGGKNDGSYKCDLTDYVYSINGEGIIDWYIPHPNSPLAVFTLEKFLEMFPYKVGDRVQSKWSTHNHNIYIIKSMEWDSFMGQVYYTIKNTDGIVNQFKWTAQELKFYQSQKIMEEEGTLVQIDLTRELCVADEVEVILGDYEFALKDGKTYFIKKKPQYPQYPKTYEECCEVLMGLMGKTDFQDYSLLFTKLSTKINEANSISPEPPHITLINNFYKLLICRDAYWKIAGERMGLGKPWEPDDCQIVYSIGRDSNRISLCNDMFGGYFILEFPTEEMRDAFYENFKNLIEACKELL